MPSTTIDQLRDKIAFLMDYRRLLLASPDDKAAEIEANNSKIRALGAQIERIKTMERRSRIRRTVSATHRAQRPEEPPNKT